MKNGPKKLGKKGRLAIIAGAAATVLLVIALVIPGVLMRRAAAASTGAAETLALHKSDLTQSISVSGVVETAQTTNIYSTLNYPVKELLVEVGDMVAAGDIIAVLDTENLENDIIQAEINYSGAKYSLSTSVANAKNSLASTQITLEQREIALANAEKDFATAKADAAKRFDSHTYDNAVNEATVTLGRRQSELQTARTDYNAARYNFDDTRYRNAIRDAENALERRKADLAVVNDAKSYLAAQDAIDDAQCSLDQARANLANAKDDAVKAAKNKMDAASKAVNDATRAYEKALNDRSRAEKDGKDANSKKVENAEKALLDAKKQLESAQNSMKNAENALRQAQAESGSAGANVASQELTLGRLGRQLAEGEIAAEAAGVITAVNAKVGAIPQGVLFVIDNKDELYISARVKEHSLNSLAIGQEILITTDATGDGKFTAALSYISPKAVSEAGSTSVEFEVRATLVDPDEAIKIGMNAFLNIITDIKENVYAVPVSAVVTNGKGSFIYAVPESAPGGRHRQNEEPKRLEIPVTLGLKTSTSVEVIGAGLKDGLRILTDPEGKLSDGAQRGFGMMPFGRGR